MIKKQDRKTQKQKQIKSETKPILKQPKTNKRLKKQQLQDLDDIANLLRIDSIKSTNITKTALPIQSASAAEIMATLFFFQTGIQCNPRKPDSFINDRFILSKPHAAPILYATLARAGFFPLEQILSLRKKDSLLQGFPVRSIPFIDVTTGSPGMGLGLGAGMAYSSKYYDKIDNRIFVLIGDEETAEGSIWQSASFASHYKLNNLIGILDVNDLGHNDQTMYYKNCKSFASKFNCFGWETIKVDGHNCNALIKAFEMARQTKNKPVMIIANTIKGRGMTNNQIKGKPEWNNKSFEEGIDKIIQSIQKSIKKPRSFYSIQFEDELQTEFIKQKVQVYPTFPEKISISTNKAFAEAFKKAYESNNFLVVLDGDTKNQTFSKILHNCHKQAHIECFIAEQNMVEVGIGLSTRRRIPFIYALGAFFTKAADVIRIGGISKCNFKLVGSSCGVHIGEDGPTQMALSDIAFMRTVPNLVIFYPSDGVSTFKAVQLACNYDGPVFIRTSKPDMQLLYSNKQQFQIGKCKVIKKSQQDKLLIVSSGITLHEAMKAASKLQESCIKVRIIDLFCLKPIDCEDLATNAIEAGNMVLTIEDHYREGGIHDLVSSGLTLKCIPVHGIYVQRVPNSASPKEQLQVHGLDFMSIMNKVKQILKL